MEILNEFLFGNPEVQKAAVFLPALAAAAPGIIKAVGSMFGSRKRKREEQAAAANLKQRMGAYEGFQFKDPSAGMTNPYEDLTVNTQAAEFAAQQQQQALAGTLGQLQGTAGSSGIAALAQSLAQQQSRNLQAASASIAQQEAANQMARARGQQMLEQQRAAGAAEVQQFELGRTETLLDIASERKLRATAARQQAKQDLIGGVAEAGGAFLGRYFGGLPDVDGGGEDKENKNKNGG